MFKPRRKAPVQTEFWVMADRLPKAGPGRFYEFLKGTLEKMDFATQVRARCAPADAEAARGGRPGMEPGSPSTRPRYSPPPPRWFTSRG